MLATSVEKQQVNFFSWDVHSLRLARLSGGGGGLGRGLALERRASSCAQSLGGIVTASACCC